MIARLFKVYCYRGKTKNIWFEAEDTETGNGIAWSPSLKAVEMTAEKLGYELLDIDNMIIKMYRAPV